MDRLWIIQRDHYQAHASHTQKKPDYDHKTSLSGYIAMAKRQNINNLNISNKAGRGSDRPGHHLTYLGSVVDTQGGTEADVKAGIGKATVAFFHL